MHHGITSLILAYLATATAADAGVTRVATYNVAMGLEAAGALCSALTAGSDLRLLQVAEILQRVRPDVVLLNEFDYDPGCDSAGLLNDKYLARGRNRQRPLRFPHHFRAPVNSGVASGRDLDGDGRIGGPGDAWGFGHFPGQYGMLLLSRHPLRGEDARTFATFRWSALPDARRPWREDGNPFHTEETWQRLLLSSKSHWDVTVDIGGRPLHLLAFHPTPPVFDGPENRNGLRNFDEIRFWLDYTRPTGAAFVVDDGGKAGGLAPGAAFVIAGDFNADPRDGDALPGAITQLLDADWVDARCLPTSTGGAEAAQIQGGANAQQAGDPAADTADFDDRNSGNLRVDYVLPGAGLDVRGCGVFWPGGNEDGHGLVTASDHRLVWLDLGF